MAGSKSDDMVDMLVAVRNTVNELPRELSIAASKNNDQITPELLRLTLERMFLKLSQDLKVCPFCFLVEMANLSISMGAHLFCVSLEIDEAGRRLILPQPPEQKKVVDSTAN